MHDVVVSRGVDTEAFGEPPIVGILEHLALPADQKRNFFGTNVETIEQSTRTVIVVEIDVHVGPGIAGQKLPNAQRIARAAGADHGYVAVPGLQNADAAENERSHEELAELGVVLHHSA